MARRTIHDFQRTIDSMHRRIQAADIPAGNRRLLLAFDQFCVAEGLSPARRAKLLNHLFLLAQKQLRGPFRSATRKQIWDAVYAIESSDYAPWTKRDYKFAIKKFFKFVWWGRAALHRRGYPAAVAGVYARVKKRDQVRVQAGDILTEEEAERLVASAHDAQQRALLSIMYELGPRVSEIGTMRISDVSRDRYSYICDLDGKTGPRSVRVIRSAGALTAWLNVHPERGTGDAPLWGRVYKGKWRAVGYAGINAHLRAAVRAAGITKRVYHHLLRHSRITHVLASGQMNEAQMKKFFGLAPDSGMLAVYAHLISKDANDAALRMHGIIPAESSKPIIPPRCGMCGEHNSPDGQFCARCGYALRIEAAKDPVARTEAAGERVNQFLKQPEIEQAFREMVREEIRSALAQTPRPPGAPQAPPIQGRPPAKQAA